MGFFYPVKPAICPVKFRFAEYYTGSDYFNGDCLTKTQIIMKTFEDLSDAQKTEIDEHYAAIGVILEGKAENLSMEKRQSLPKIGRHRNSFVQKAMEIANKTPDIIADFFQVSLWETNYALFKKYKNLELSSKTQEEKLLETGMIVGSDVLGDALQYKEILEGANRNQPGLDDYAKELQEFFEQTAKDDDDGAEEIQPEDVLE